MRNEAYPSSPEPLEDELEEEEVAPALPLGAAAEHTWQVGPEHERARLDHVLAALLPTHSRSRLQTLVREGHVLVNGTPAKPSLKLRGGETIALREPPAVRTEVEPENIPLEVLYEDADVIVVNKPVGMVVHAGAGHWRGTLVNALLHHCGELSQIGGEIRPGIVHRLDKETSGCLMAAKNDQAHRSLVAQLSGREVRKIYLALAGGKFTKLSGNVREPIGRHPVDRKRMAVVSTGRDASTDWRVLGEVPVPAAPGKLGTLVECTLHTGRTHQIRVHLKHLGHAILGDKVYGQAAGFERQMLHAWQLGFRHPRTGQTIACTAPLPPDFRAAGLEKLLPAAESR